MWAANLNQVYENDAQGKEFSSWILLLCNKARTKKEVLIRSKHEYIDEILRAQNVIYTEITTEQGKQFVYKKFGHKAGKHPLFLVLKTHPLKYAKEDPFMLIEWGKWNDIELLKDDLISFINFFSDEDFREGIANAKDKPLWKKLGKFLEDNGVGIFGIGANIAVALL